MFSLALIELAMTTLVASLAFLLLLYTTTTARPTKTVPTTLPLSTRLPLVNLASLSGSEARIRRDAIRAAALVNQLSGGPKTELGLLRGEVAVTVGIGTPPVKQTLILDTASDLLWLQCEPCNNCFSQPDPMFDPTGSSSFHTVPCVDSGDPDAHYCNLLDWSPQGCDTIVRACTFKYSYADGSYSRGVLSLETLTIGDMEISNAIVGCGMSNSLTTSGVDGILGLSMGSVSLMSQSAEVVGHMFSYCLSGSGGTNGGGWLEFGRSDYPSAAAAWVPLVTNPKIPSFYYVTLTGIGVNGERVPGVTANTFRILDGGDGGAMIDTGTTITRLPEGAYMALRDKFREKMGGATPLNYSFFDTCYHLSGSDTIPTVSLYLSDDPSPSITSKWPMFEVEQSLNCLAFAPTPPDSSLTIIGNIQQQGTRITIDLGNKNIGLGPDVC